MASRTGRARRAPLWRFRRSIRRARYLPPLIPLPSAAETAATALAATIDSLLIRWSFGCMPAVTVQVPASTTNFGPGFDCFGAALNLWNYVTVEEAGDNEAPLMALEAAERFFASAEMKSHPVQVLIKGAVPPARGLGSSVTLRLGTLLGLNALHDFQLQSAELFALCADLESHPDNAAAACFGGFVIAKNNRVQKITVDQQLTFVLFVPDFEVKTSDARRVLPQTYSREDIVQNLANASLIAACLAERNYEGLTGCFNDRIHQPYREPLVPFLSAVIAAGQSAGAFGGFLSGSGSTIACLTVRDPAQVAKAMAGAAACPGSTLTIGVDNEGARVVSSAEHF
jgi:homoserine kinase